MSRHEFYGLDLVELRPAISMELPFLFTFYSDPIVLTYVFSFAKRLFVKDSVHRERWSNRIAGTFEDSFHQVRARCTCKAPAALKV